MQRKERAIKGILLFFVLAAPFFLAKIPARADEGMWTFHDPPLKKWKELYGFEPSQEWLDHVRLASVRFNDGGSGGFVSSKGLVMTNHHVALGQLQKLSSPQKDYVADGFYARTQDEEVKCPDLELNVLVSMEDVTKRVHAAIQEGVPDKEANEQRKAEISKIELESFKKTGLRSNVVSLYEGGEYWLYRYKKYTDVRLVFAPEQQAAFFGGDPDNFTYPRYDLDVAFFRIYEDNKPVHPEHYFGWSRKGAAQGEMVFVSGNPGGTDRQKTMAQLEFQRDVYLPEVLKVLKYRLAALRKYSERGSEEARRAKSRIFGYENSLKALTGEYEGLLDPKLMAKKAAAENEFRERVVQNPALQKEYGSAWEEIAEAQKKLEGVFTRNLYRNMRRTLMGKAITIVQLVAEVEKPNDERLEEYRESNLDSLKFDLFSPAPIYPDFEEMMMTTVLDQSVEELGVEDPFLRKLLKGRSPARVAQKLIQATRIADPEFRKSLVEGGKKAVEESEDPLIILTRELDGDIREMRKYVEDNVESVVTRAGTQLAMARFKVYGKSVNPDANFTLRLSYGTVRGYPEGTTLVPYKTTFYGLFDRAESFDNEYPFSMAPKFNARRNNIDLSTPLNFVCNADIIGGNSGSPVINRNAEIVGVIFDGNIQSLTANYLYDGDIHRAVSVHSAGIIEALRKIYDAGDMVEELERGR